MKWTRVCVEAIAYELPEERVSTASLETKLKPMYSALNLDSGQVEALTGITERRFWPPGPRMSECAARAGRKALEASGVPAMDLGAVIYAGVCRDNLEPATACAVAEALGTGRETDVVRPTSTMPDFQTAVNDWATGSFVGICLRDVSQDP